MLQAAEKGKKTHKIKYGSAAAAREVCWWGGGFLLVPSVELGATGSLSAAGLVGAGGWIAG